MISDTEIIKKRDADNLLVCPVCKGTKFFNWRKGYDDRHGHPDLFQLVNCLGCNHIMTTPMPTEDELAQLYSTYYARNNIAVEQVANQAGKVDFIFSKISRWWRGDDNHGQYFIRAGEKMLDIGCGSGLSLLEAKRLGAEAWGIEADPNVKRFAAELNLRIHQGSLYEEPFKGIMFDLIILNQVIEHMPEPDKVLRIIRTRLANNGRVILVFPNINSLWCKLTGSRWINWHIPFHLHHFNKMTFTHMAESNGYQVVHTRTITPNIWTIMQLRVIRQNLKRGEPNPIWKIKVPQVSQHSNINNLVFIRKLLLPPLLLVIAVINRIVDSAGFGDSLMVELKLKEVD